MASPPTPRSKRGETSEEKVADLSSPGPPRPVRTRNPSSLRKRGGKGSGAASARNFFFFPPLFPSFFLPASFEGRAAESNTRRFSNSGTGRQEAGRPQGWGGH